MARGAAAAPSSEADEAFMRRCLELAAESAGRTAPNPMVGCLIVRRGKVIAEGRHRRAGDRHAEIEALDRLGGRAPGATLYVNLEPCDHHGRTPPCAPALMAAGISRVVIGMRDPIAHHAGGARRLSRSGITVELGVLERECRELNRGFVSLAARGRPFVTLKVAATLDGAAATASGDARWITGAAARRDGHRLRDRLDGILVGIGTLLADDPRLTCRLPGGRDPVRVVVDGRLRTPIDAAVLPGGRRSTARTIIATSDAAPESRARRLVQRGAEVWRLGRDAAGQVDMAELFDRLGDAGLTTLLVEGGPSIHRSLLAAGLADELVVYLAPRVVGGGLGWLGGPPIERLRDSIDLRLSRPAESVGDDLKLTYALRSHSR